MTEIQIFKRKFHTYTQIEKFLFCIKNTQLKKKKIQLKTLKNKLEAKGPK